MCICDNHITKSTNPIYIACYHWQVNKVKMSFGLNEFDWLNDFSYIFKCFENFVDKSWWNEIYAQFYEFFVFAILIADYGLLIQNSLKSSINLFSVNGICYEIWFICALIFLTDRVQGNTVIVRIVFTSIKKRRFIMSSSIHFRQYFRTNFQCHKNLPMQKNWIKFNATNRSVNIIESHNWSNIYIAMNNISSFNVHGMERFARK